MKYCEKQQEGDDISAQYDKKNSKIEVIHIHKRTEYSLQLTELISGRKSEKFIQKKTLLLSRQL